MLYGELGLVFFALTVWMISVLDVEIKLIHSAVLMWSHELDCLASLNLQQQSRITKSVFLPDEIA